MISGRDALAQMEQTIAAVRTEETRLDQALRSAEAEAARLRQERADSYKALARLKLDLMLRDQFVGELDAAERSALRLLEERRAELSDLAARRDAAAKDQEAAEAERHGRAETFENALAALEAKRAEVAPRVKATQDWIAQKAKVDAAFAIAGQSEQKAAQAEADREAKRKPYEADLIFMYLWNRRFGTSEYRAGNLVRFVDRWVADLVGYAGARPNYHMLNEIPLRLRAHAERSKAAAEAEKTALSEIERAGLIAAGTGPFEEAFAKAQAALAEAEQRLAARKQALAELDRQHAQTVAGTESGPLAQAVAILSEADSKLDLATLNREARRTATPDDDAIIRRIDDIETAIGRADAEVGQIRTEMRELAKRRDGIEQVRDASRQRGYDNPYGSFANESVIAQILVGIAKGVLQSTVLDQVLRESYRRRQSPVDFDFGRGGGIQLPGSGGDGGGWWPGGGGGSPPSGGSSGDFRTGGSF